MPLRVDLFGHLTADFAARVRCGVDVDIVLSGGEIGGLGVGQRGAAFGGGGSDAGDGNGHAGVLAGLGGAMEMRGGRRSGEAGISDLPAQLLGSGIIIDVGGAGRGGGVRRPRRKSRVQAQRDSRR